MKTIYKTVYFSACALIIIACWATGNHTSKRQEAIQEPFCHVQVTKALDGKQTRSCLYKTIDSCQHHADALNQFYRTQYSYCEKR